MKNNTKTENAENGKRNCKTDVRKSLSEAYGVNDVRNYIWVNPDLVILIRQRIRRRKGRKSFLDHYLYLCSTIYFLQNIDRRYQEDEFVPINYKTITSIISRSSYSEIVRNLKDWSVISVDDSYQAGERSKGFKLNSPFNRNVKKRPIKDELINQKLNIHKKKELEYIEQLPFPYQFLALTNTWVEMDTKAAYKYNEETYPSTPKYGRYETNFYSISAYGDEDYRIAVDGFGNRIHTNLTNLKSDFRPFLSVDGVSLGQVDVKNSQPCFFYTYIKRVDGIPKSEVLDYKRLVESGLFYEFFMSEVNIPLQYRDREKKRILIALFTDKNRKVERPYQKVFKERFPAIASHIRQIKEDDYKVLARELQRAESNFIIEKVVAEFMNSFTDSEYVGTIHDSVVVKSTHLGFVEQVMSECFEKEGIRARLSVSDFSRDDAHSVI